MFNLQYRLLCKKATAISIHNYIHTHPVLLARSRKNSKPRPVLYEPGMKHWNNSLQLDQELSQEFPEEFQDENDIEDVDLFNYEKLYDAHSKEEKKHKAKIQKKIIEAKFFAPRTQPLMLTWNEKCLINHLHKEDPVQWNIKTLSESFPATPETIKKIIKSKAKITPERIKIMDSRAQRNWELLKEGKLDADPHVLEHLKKFVNRREILLEQIPNPDFYLPEKKKEPVWNKGEMFSIIENYEKALERLTEEAQQNQQLKCLKDGESEDWSTRKEKKSSLDLVNEEIQRQGNEKSEFKDSFVFKEMMNTFKKHSTLEEFENELMRKAERREELALSEKAILESKLGVRSLDHFKNVNKSRSNAVKNSNRREEETGKVWFEKKNAKTSYIKFDKDYPENNTAVKMRESDNDTYLDNCHDGTKVFTEEEVGKFLSITQTKSESQEKQITKAVIKEKSIIDISEPERLKRENTYYDKEVTDIANTSFWNSSRSSKEKAMAEYEKQSHEEPKIQGNVMFVRKTAVLSTDVYPERIKIPKNKRGSGLIFKVKDCYYDDDGEFLYRVPGLTKVNV